MSDQANLMYRVGDIVSSLEGDRVWVLTGEIGDGSNSWSARVIFETPCGRLGSVRQTGSHHIVNTRWIRPFGAVRLGLLYDSVITLVSECRKAWNHCEHEGPTQS